jgi:hypothetical protein
MSDPHFYQDTLPSIPAAHEMSGRRPLDLYPTEDAITRLLAANLPNLGGNILEPCAGPGGMAAVLRDLPAVTAVFTNDIDPQWGTDWVGDACNPAAACWQRPYDWVVTNPPFSVAMPILQLAYDRAAVGVAFLLRLSFLEPTRGRARWLEAHADSMTHLIVLGQPRPSFTGDGGTDAVTAAWMVWQVGWSWKALGVEPPFQFAYKWHGH